MFSYQGVNGAKNVSLEDSEKNENFWKMTFYPKMVFFFLFFFCFFLLLFFLFFSFFFFFFSRISEINYFSQNNDLAKSCKFHFLGVKDPQKRPEKEVNPLGGYNFLDDSP